MASISLPLGTESLAGLEHSVGTDLRALVDGEHKSTSFDTQVVT